MNQDELDMNVKLEHLKRAVDWLRGEKEPALINHEFNQETWGNQTDCDTAGCLWGTAYLLANSDISGDRPCFEWRNQSEFYADLYNSILDRLFLDKDEIIKKFDWLLEFYKEELDGQ